MGDGEALGLEAMEGSQVAGGGDFVRFSGVDLRQGGNQVPELVVGDEGPGQVVVEGEVLGGGWVGLSRCRGWSGGLTPWPSRRFAV